MAVFNNPIAVKLGCKDFDSRASNGCQSSCPHASAATCSALAKRLSVTLGTTSKGLVAPAALAMAIPSRAALAKILTSLYSLSLSVTGEIIKRPPANPGAKSNVALLPTRKSI